MRYNLHSFLPENAFSPRSGKVLSWGMTLEGGGGGGDKGGGKVSDTVSNVGAVFSDVGNTVSDTVSNAVENVGNAVSDVGNAVSDTVSNAAETVGDAGAYIDDKVNDSVPGGWGTVGAVAVAAATGYLDPTVFAADVGAEAGAAEVAGSGLEALAPEVVAPEVVAPEVAEAIAPEVIPQTAAQTGLDSLVAQQSALYPAVGDNVIGLPQLANSLENGAIKGALTNVATNALTGHDITPQGVLTGALTGAVGGGAGNVAGQLGAADLLGGAGPGIAGGLAGGATGALLTGGDPVKGAEYGALTGGVAGATGDLLGGTDPSIKAAGQNIAGGLTNAAITGNTNNLAQNLTLGSLASAGLTGIYNSGSGDKQVASTGDPFNDALIAAMNNPTDVSGNQTYETVAGRQGSVELGNFSNINPTTTDANGPLTPLVPSDSSLSPKAQYDGLIESGVDSKTASEMSGYDPNQDLSNIDLTYLPTNTGEGGTNLSGNGTDTSLNGTNLSGNGTSTGSGYDETGLNNLINQQSALYPQPAVPSVSAGAEEAVKEATPSDSLSTIGVSITSPSVRTTTSAPSTPSTSDGGSQSPTQTSSSQQTGGIPSIPSGHLLQNSGDLLPLQLLSPLQQLQMSQSPFSQSINPKLMAQIQPAANRLAMKRGGKVSDKKPETEEHIPEFVTGETGHYVKGAGDGQSDDIPAMLADGEYVFDADTVAQLGNGSSDAGAQLLDHFREVLREHKRSAPNDKIPPPASPLQYMKEALERHGVKQNKD